MSVEDWDGDMGRSFINTDTVLGAFIGAFIASVLWLVVFL